MKNKNKLLIYPLIIMGLVLILSNNCKKDTNNTDNNNNNNNNQNKPIIFNPNLTYGTISDIDNNKYKTITIGTQTWMAENLKTTKYNNDTAIPLIKDDTAWYNLSSPAYSWYNNDAATYNSIYGALYNWYAVNTGKLCPIGWHMPTDSEITTLTTYLGGESEAGSKMEEVGITHWVTSNTSANNSSGFTALPAGDRASDGSFSNLGYIAYFWSATEIGPNVAVCRTLLHYNACVNRCFGYKQDGFSVRCVKD